MIDTQSKVIKMLSSFCWLNSFTKSLKHLHGFQWLNIVLYFSLPILWPKVSRGIMI